MYRQIKNDPENVIELILKRQNAYNALASIKEKDEMFYEIRNSFNDAIENKKNNAETAADFIFLNKSGFNGVYRVNANGLFNVPSAHRKQISAITEQNILVAADLLNRTTILNGDFEAACETAQKGDFIFFDSPYYNTFDTYQKSGFSEEDHMRLAKLFKRLDGRGAYCVLTNSNEDFIKNLYAEYNQKVVDVKRMVNRNKNGRNGQEIIITNYWPPGC